MTISNGALATIDRLKSNYNPDNNVNPPWPHIDWADAALLSIIEELVAQNAALEARIDALEAQINTIEYTLERAEAVAIWSES